MVANSFEPLFGGVLASPIPVVEGTDLASLQYGVGWGVGLGVDACLVHEVVHAYKASVVRGKSCREATSLRVLPASYGRFEASAIVVVPLIAFFL